MLMLNLFPILLLVPTLVPGADTGAKALVGTKVIFRASESVLKVEDRIVARGDVHRVYQVSRANGTWLWLVAERVRGWAPAAEVIPLDQALEYFTAELQRHPHSAWAHHMRGLVWYDLNDYDKAIADEDEAIALAPTDALAYFNRGNSHFAKGDYLKAISDYNHATQLDPRDASSYENRGLAWAAQHEYELAIADLNEAIRLDPEGESKFRHRAQCWQARSHYAEALADYDKALLLMPEDAAALNGRAWIWATCPEAPRRAGTRAVAEATRACSFTEWKDPYTLGTLAAAAAEAGDFAAAVKWEVLALDLLPKDDPDRESYRQRLALYQERKPFRETPAQAPEPAP
jgi:tetratricopeptide (TPR) repeat protein